MACGIEFPDQGSKPGPLHWEYGVLAIGPPGKPLFLLFFLKKYSRNKIIGNLKLQKKFLLLLEGLEDYMAGETWQTRQRRNKSEWTREKKELMKSNVWIQKGKRQNVRRMITIKNNSQNWVSYLFKLESSTRYSAIGAQWTNPHVWCITVTF